MHPEDAPRKSHVEECLADRAGPVVAATDYMQSYAEQIRQFVPSLYSTLGTDGFGRSDRRSDLRKHFEVDRHHITIAALKALADEGDVPYATVTDAIKGFGIDTDKTNPAIA